MWRGPGSALRHLASGQTGIPPCRQTRDGALAHAPINWGCSLSSPSLKQGFFSSRRQATIPGMAIQPLSSLMSCRPGCAACCTAPSISSPMPGLPQGKPAGVACPHLDEALRCRLFGLAERPAVCGSLQPEPDMCGDNRAHAMHWLTQLEVLTAHQPASAQA
jgi:hypothetical protein